MKHFVLLGLTLCLSFAMLDNSSHAEPPELKLSAPAVAAYDKLHQTELFALGGTGYAATISESETNFRELQRDPNSVAAFIALLDDETTAKAGQLYALLGLKEAEHPQFEERLPAFLEDDSTAMYMSGCIVMPMEVKEIAANFVDKKRVSAGSRLKSALSVFAAKK